MSDGSDLKDALITAGLALLDEGGLPALTLRKMAARAGVSHAAPAHHFDGLRGLRTAIAARAFSRFSASMQARRATAGPEPFDQLLAICQGYLDFAAAHGALFQVMFNADIDRCEPALVAASIEAYCVLREGCLPFSDGTPDPALEAAVWSAVHGFAALGLAGPPGTGPIPEKPDFAAILRRLLGPDADRGQVPGTPPGPSAD